MQKLFFGIYGAILVSTLIVLACSYYALSSINQYRYQLHLENVMEGTITLLSRGVERQEPQNRERWIGLASSLLDANLYVDTLKVASQQYYSIQPVTNQSDGTTDKYVVQYRAAHSEQQITLEFEGVTEHILTATAFLMLNELGRIPAAQRQSEFNELVNTFNYDVFRVHQSNLDLDSRQRVRLQNGDTVVALKRNFGQGSTFNVYAPWGKTNDALVLGPIAFFNPFPLYIAALVLGAALLIMAAVVMLIIRKLGNRLVALQDRVDAISPEVGTEDNVIPRNSDDGEEVIEALSTKIQNMALRIEKLLDEKAYMIRAVSHDLRTPIAKLHFRLEALTEKLGSDNKLLRACHDDLRQLNLLIDELLTYEKLSVKQEIQFSHINLTRLLSEQIEGVRVLHPSLSINLLCSEAPIEIQGNEILLHRLFENLLHNAGRHANSEINVILNIEKDQVCVSVDDNGSGLDEVVIPQLFEPFFRADASRTSGKGGYGLGLAIVKQVVMQHSGEINATNNKAGGARFRVSLPVGQSSNA